MDEDDKDAEPLDRLAERLQGLSTADAQALADAEGVELAVRDQQWVIYQDTFRDGRITVDALEGVVTRAVRG